MKTLLKETERGTPWLTMPEIAVMEGEQGNIVRSVLEAYIRHNGHVLETVQMTPKQEVSETEYYWIFNLGQVFYSARVVDHLVTVKNDDNGNVISRYWLDGVERNVDPVMEAHFGTGYQTNPKYYK
jgi:hypothetical protein